MILRKTRSNLKYLLDSFLFYLAGSQAPYIHVILSYIVSITLYITQPLVRILLCIINLQLVCYHLHRYELCNDLIQFLVGMFSFQSEYILPDSVSTFLRARSATLVSNLRNCKFRKFETEGIEMPGGANSDVSHTCHNNAAIYEIS